MAELAAAAEEATAAAGLEPRRADLIVVAVPTGTDPRLTAELERVARNGGDA